MDVDRLEGVRRRWGVPALGAGTVTAEGEVTTAVVGVRRRGGGPVSDGDAWHIGSCGKSMTAALYGLLVQEGRTRWDTPLGELFADLDVHPGWRDVPVERVLINEGGVPANPSREEMLAGLTDPRPPREQRSALAARYLADRPGSLGTFVYSNLGYTLVGAAIERLLDEPFEEALAGRLLAPLGIATAGFGPPPDLWGHRGRLAVAGIQVGRGAPVDPALPEADNPTLIGPAGRLHLSLDDWTRFLRLFLVGADAGGPIEPATLARLLAVAPGDGQRQAMGWAPAQGIEGVSLGQQGSNTLWVATALLDADRERAAMVVVNDGRTVLMRRAALLAAELATR